MMKRETLSASLLRQTLFPAMLAIVASSPGVFAADASSRPNVVLIFADDLGYGDLGCYGATKLKTPNIDKLAAEGRRFTDAHSSSAVCTPSRYGLLTGRYPIRANGGRGLWGPAPVTSPLLIDTETLTIADVFKGQGYDTAVFGKWHLGFGKGKNDWQEPLRPGPQDLGFDYYFGMPVVNSAPPWVPWHYSHGAVVSPDQGTEPIFGPMSENSGMGFFLNSSQVKVLNARVLYGLPLITAIRKALEKKANSESQSTNHHVHDHPKANQLYIRDFYCSARLSHGAA